MVGILGGTGSEGFGLAVRWASAGVPVAIGSRIKGRAEDSAARVRSLVPRAEVSGETNLAVATTSEIVVVAVPYQALGSTVSSLTQELAGKVIVSVVAAIDWVDKRPVPLRVEAGSAAQELQGLLPDCEVTSAFHTLSAEKLATPDSVLREDTIVCGDAKDARRTVIELAEQISGLRALSGGRLANSYYPEQLVGLLATLNRIHKARSGLKLVDIGGE